MSTKDLANEVESFLTDDTLSEGKLRKQANDLSVAFQEILDLPSSPNISW